MLLIVCLITTYVPQIIYFNQREYFAAYFIELIQPSVFFGFLSVLLFTFLLVLLPKKLLKFIISILLLLSLLIWVYVECFSVSYGPLDGSVIDFNHFKQRGYIEVIIFGFALLMALFFHRFFIKHLPFVVLLVLIGQLVFTFINVYQEPLGMNKILIRDQEEDMDIEFYKYSSDKNIILIVLDAFGSEYFQQALIENPSIADNLEGFVGYTDTISNYSYTKGSVPSFLTGKMIPEKDTYNNFLSNYVSNFGLPRMFSEKGYLVSVISSYTWFKHLYKERYISQPQFNQNILNRYYSAQLLDYSLFRVLPHFIKPKIFNEGDWFVSDKVSNNYNIPHTYPETGKYFLELMTDNMMIDDRTPRFKMIHVTTPHPEYRFDRDCEKIKLPVGEQAMLEQSMCVLKSLDVLLNRYKEKGIYNKSLIVVTSDHGARVMTDKSLTGFPSYFEMSSSGALFMIKGIGQKDDFSQVSQPFSLIKLYDAMLNEELHFSKYDFLQDNMRLFYAYRYHHEGHKDYLPDAPLFEVGPNFSNPENWKLKRFVTHECKPQNFPLKMTFNTNGREGYCSIYGFTEPHSTKTGSSIESIDSRIILELNKESINRANTYNVTFNFSTKVAQEHLPITFKVLINNVGVGEHLITKEGDQSVTFSFKGNLIQSSKQTVIQLLIPELMPPNEMSINNDTRKLGLTMNSVEIN